MKLFLIALLAVAASPASASQKGKIGAGPILGVPFGASAKYWVDDRWAAQGAVGVSDGDLTTSVDALKHFDDVLPRKRAGRIPVYAGMGLKLKSERSTFAGFRFVAGVSLFAAKDPLEFFAEVAPVLRFAPSEGGAFDGAVGARWYFN